MTRSVTWRRTFFLITALLISVFIISSCKTGPALSPDGQDNPQPADVSPTSSSMHPSPTPIPEVMLSLNGYPFSLNHPAILLHDLLWLPAKETFSLLGISNINQEDDFISAAFTKTEGEWVNCHFPVGKNSFSTDTANDVWIDTEYPAFVVDNEIYLNQEMIEGCVGLFIQFTAAEKTADLSVPDRQISPIQAGNSNPTTFISFKDPQQIADTRIGSLVSGIVKTPASDWLNWTDRLKLDGFTRTRITLNASDGPAVEDSLGNIEEGIPNDYIAVYQKLDDLGILTRYSLNFWDLEYRKQGGSISYQRLSTPEEVDRYLDYVRMVVTSLKGLVDEYELWNEPDANSDFYQRIEPEDYIAVAKQVIPIIREIDPKARIVLISSSSFIDLPCQEYSNILLESDILSLGDAISLHTVNNDASPEFKSDYYYGYDEMWEAIKANAEANGFSGEYYADELNYRSEYSLSVLQPEIGDYYTYKPEVAAKYIGRMIVANLGMDISVGTSGTNPLERPVESAMIQSMAYLMEGLQATPFEVETISDSDLLRYYTFKDRSNNSYLAIWNDAAALIESQDVEASLLVKNLSAKSVTAYNPYLLNSQTLVFSNTADGVILDQLMVKDYPLIIKLEE